MQMMRIAQRGVIAIVFGLCAMLLSLEPAGAQQDGEAKAFLASLSQRAIGVAQDSAATQSDREERFRTLLREGFDVPRIARFVLGSHWRRITKEQRREFVAVFEDVMVLQSLQLFSKYQGETFDIQAIGPDSANPKLTSASTTILRPNGARVKVDWRMFKRGENYKIIDIVAEGVSMAMALRSEYSSVIQQSGGKVDALIAQLRKKAA